MPSGKGTYGSKRGRPPKKKASSKVRSYSMTKKKAFKPCSKCKMPAKCKRAGKCLGKK